MSDVVLPAATQVTSPDDAAPAGPAHRWWILAVVGLAQLMVVLDATVVNIALPSAQMDLGFSNADRQWVVTAYSLSFGGLLLLGGRLSDSRLPHPSPCTRRLAEHGSRTLGLITSFILGL